MVGPLLSCFISPPRYRQSNCVAPIPCSHKNGLQNSCEDSWIPAVDPRCLSKLRSWPDFPFLATFLKERCLRSFHPNKGGLENPRDSKRESFCRAKVRIDPILFGRRWCKSTHRLSGPYSSGLDSIPISVGGKIQSCLFDMVNSVKKLWHFLDSQARDKPLKDFHHFGLHHIPWQAPFKMAGPRAPCNLHRARLGHILRPYSP